MAANQMSYPPRALAPHPGCIGYTLQQACLRTKPCHAAYLLNVLHQPIGVLVGESSTYQPSIL